MNILGITIMRTKHIDSMGRAFEELVAKNIKLKKDNDHLDSHSKILIRKLDSAFAEINCLNAEIARLREIEAKYADLLIAHEALKAEHTRWTDRGPDGKFVGDKP